MNDRETIESVEAWVRTMVVGEHLCPFADRVLKDGRVRFTVTHATSEEALLEALAEELTRLNRDAGIETTLLIHPYVLVDFFDYNQFLDRADLLLRELDCEGVFQIASFHPDYQFADTAPDAPENYSNRSTYPLLHILREESVELAIAGYGDIEAVPSRNIAHLESLGVEALKRIWEASRKPRER